MKCPRCSMEFECREFREYHWKEVHENEIKVIPKHVIDRVKAEILEKILNYMNKKKLKGSQHGE